MTDTSASPVRRVHRLVVPLSVGVLLTWAVVLWPRTVDDAYITYRYAENLASGDGAVYNKGERVEGFSSPAWMLALSLPIRAGLDPVAVSKVIGAAAALALVLLLHRALARAGCDPWVSGLACVVLASLPSLHFSAVSGMETIPFGAAVAALSLSPRCSVSRAGRAGLWGIVALVAVAALRPEGALVALAITALSFEAGRIRKTVASTWPAWAALASLLALRFSYYGRLVPNTFAAKPSPILQPLLAGRVGGAIFEVARSTWNNVLPAGTELGSLPGALLVLAGVLWGGETARRAATAVGCGLLFVLYAPSDWMLGHRFAIPFAAPYLYLAAIGADRLRRSAARRSRLLTVSLALGTALWIALANGTTLGYLARFRMGKVNPAQDAEKYLGIGRWLRAHSRPGDRLLAYEIGGAGYASGLFVIDHEGLVSPEVARIVESAEGGLFAVRFGPNEEARRAVVRYCVAQHPDWYMVRSFSETPMPIGQPIPSSVALTRLDQTIVETLGPSMSLAARFPLRRRPDGRLDSYLILRRADGNASSPPR